MPKPENPGEHGRDKKEKRSKGVQKWLDKGYKAVTLAKGETEVEEISLTDPSKESIALGGQIFGESGKKLTGRNRPHLSVTESSTGALITSSKPASENITIVYKLVDDVESDEDESDDEVTPSPTLPVL